MYLFDFLKLWSTLTLAKRKLYGMLHGIICLLSRTVKFASATGMSDNNNNRNAYTNNIQTQFVSKTGASSATPWVRMAVLLEFSVNAIKFTDSNPGRLVSDYSAQSASDL